MDRNFTTRKEQDHLWISTNDALPGIGERVLIISKFSHISDATLRDFGAHGTPVFSPDGLKPGIDVKWWMPIPTDGWRDIKEAQPKEGEMVLTMGSYGKIYNGTWKMATYETEPSFHPFVWEVLFWRPLPDLPPGVSLK